MRTREEVEKEEKSAALGHWMHRLEGSLEAQMKWVTRGAAEDVAHTAADATGESAIVWPASPPIHDLKGEDFRRRFRTMAATVGGPDGWWRAANLTKLPLRWHSCLAQLWNYAMHKTVLPRRWSAALGSLIPKQPTGERPITVASVVWRAGMGLTMVSLNDWAQMWAPPEMQGGLAQRGVGRTHGRLSVVLARAEEQKKVFSIISQDLAKAFDRVDVWQATALAKRMGCPSNICAPIRCYYDSGRRLFLMKGCVTPRWATSTASSRAVLVVRCS